MTLTRRALLHGLGASGLLGAVAPSWASAAVLGDKRLVLLINRGGLDGLGAVPAIGDPQFNAVRGILAPPLSGEGAALALDGQFGLHPSLAPIHGWWAEKSLAVLHATAPPYRQRSHFDSQNVLENGLSKPFQSESGWLNRAVGTLGGEVGRPMAMARTIPLVLRGDAPVTSADPLRTWTSRGALMDRIADLYAVDPELGPALDIAVATQGMLETHRGETAMGAAEANNRPDDLRKAARVIGSVMAASDGPRIAVAETTGWDSHTGQARVLERQLGGLAGALTGLRDGLGAAWEHTAVLVVTEFGRTVSPNGTGGTDHGTGGMALVVGGAVRGGKVHGSWPGLGREQLRDERDLEATTDLRALFKGAMLAHLGVDEAALEDKVFRGSRDVASLTDLFRA